MWALRAQTDKLEYSREMRRLLERTPNLDMREGMAVDIELGPNDEVRACTCRHMPADACQLIDRCGQSETDSGSPGQMKMWF